MRQEFFDLGGAEQAPVTAGPVLLGAGEQLPPDAPSLHSRPHGEGGQDPQPLADDRGGEPEQPAVVEGGGAEGGGAEGTGVASRIQSPSRRLGRGNSAP